MGDMNWLEAMTMQTQIGKVMETNQYTEKFGLSLSDEEARLIVAERTNSLRTQKRVEFGESIVPRLIYEFSDSDYSDQGNYVQTMIRLQDIFYLFKNEMMDEITDDELIHFMKEQFETICYGDLEYLEGTCLEIFAQAVRAGYRGHHRSDGRDEYAQFDEVPRWDRELYMEVLRELCWR